MSEKPIYVQLMDSIKKKIQDGQLQVGDRLVSEREMSEQYGINRMTVRNALKKLQEEGLEVNPENEKMMREKLRHDLGMGAYAKVLLPEIKELLKNNNVVLDGLYSWTEYNILKEEGITAIMVTHDIGEAASISSKVIVMSKRPSKIKNVYLMDYQDVLKPLERRKSPLFNLYYDKLWRDIDEGK